MAHGIGEYILRRLTTDGLPPTRENYLWYAFGDRNYHPDAEEEVDIPAHFRKLIL